MIPALPLNHRRLHFGSPGCPLLASTTSLFSLPPSLGCARHLFLLRSLSLSLPLSSQIDQASKATPCVALRPSLHPQQFAARQHDRQACSLIRSSRRITVLPAQGRRPVPPRPPREIQEGGKDLRRLISGLASDIDELASSGLAGLPNDVGLSVSAVLNSRSCCIFHYARLLVGVRERASEGEKGGRDTGGLRERHGWHQSFPT
ncbi:hypothetical protein EV126DRAFT_162142 [Verticillium dahliae]|nr:hypothetical protein EV126DRAFT_162142 [Verticillium dahliae]